MDAFDPKTLTRASLGHRELVTIETPHGTFKVARTPGNYGLINLYGGGESHYDEGTGPAGAQVADGFSLEPNVDVAPPADAAAPIPDVTAGAPQVPQADESAVTPPPDASSPFANIPPNTAITAAPTVPAAPVTPDVPVVPTKSAGPVVSQGLPSPLQSITKNETTSQGADAKAAQVQSDQAQNQAIQSTATAEKSMADMKAAQAEAAKNVAVDRNNLAVARRQQVDTNIQSRLTSYDAATAKLESMNVDPSQAFGDGLSWQKVMAGVGLALGAIGQGFNGKENPSVKIIQNAIQTSVEAQKANILKQGAIVDAAKGGLQTYMQVSKDKEDAFNLETARLNDIVAKQFDAISAASADPQIKARADTQKAIYLQEKAKALDAVNKNVTSTETIQGAKGQMQEVLPQAAAKDINGQEQLATNLKALADDITKGKGVKPGLGNILNGVAQKVNLDDPATTAYAAKLDRAKLGAIEAAGRFSPTLVSMIDKMFPNATSNPESAAQNLNQMALEAHKLAQGSRQGQDLKFRQPPLPNGKPYNPNTYAADMGFGAKDTSEKTRSGVK